MISEYSGYLWLIGLVAFMGWWFWQTMKPPRRDSDKHSPKETGGFMGRNARW